MIVHLVRHPPPVIAPGLCYGRLDVPACEVAETAAALKRLLPSGVSVWTSPRQRCRVLAERLHPAPCSDDRLAEMDFGAWEGQAWEAIGSIALDAWAADVAGYTPLGGESGMRVRARVLAWLAERAAGNEHEMIVITHAGVMRVLLAEAFNYAPSRWLELRFDYGAVATLTCSGGRMSVQRMFGVYC